MTRRPDWMQRMPARHVRRAARLTLSPLQWLRRRHACRTFEQSCPQAFVQMGRQVREQGFARFDARHLPHSQRVLDDCLALRAECEENLRAALALRSGKLSIAIDLASDFELQRRARLLEFALQVETCAPALCGLGTIPFLGRVAVSLSVAPEDPQDLVHFQRFHLDNDDLRHVKLYINAQDIGVDQGPLTFLPLDSTRRVLRALRRGRRAEAYWTFDDDEVFRYASRSELVTLEGPAGTGVYIDASRCLHFGSRVAPGRERLVYGAVYIPYHRIKENVSNQFESDGTRPPWQELLLDAPRRYPLGTFFPDLPRVAANEEEQR